MPTMKTTITLNQAEIAEAVTDYLRGKRYDARSGVTFEDEAGNELPWVRATATVEPIARKKRGSEEDEAAK